MVLSVRALLSALLKDWQAARCRLVLQVVLGLDPRPEVHNVLERRPGGQ